MNFDELHAHIPYAIGGKAKTLTMSPYPNIVLAMPGRHAKETAPKGGDFVVMVSDPVFNISDHQFTHKDIFEDVLIKKEHDDIDFFMRAYLGVIAENDPLNYSPGDTVLMPGINFTTFLCAVQCLAVAEHRRYSQYEAKFGGRYLPFRFAAGIAEGLWTVEDAKNTEKQGRPGVEMLEKFHGVPELTKELMNNA